MFDTDQEARDLVALVNNTGGFQFERTEITADQVVFLRAVCHTSERRTFTLFTNAERVIFWQIECDDAKQVATVRHYLQSPTVRGYHYKQQGEAS